MQYDASFNIHTNAKARVQATTIEERVHSIVRVYADLWPCKPIVGRNKGNINPVYSRFNQLVNVIVFKEASEKASHLLKFQQTIKLQYQVILHSDQERG